MNKHYAIFVDYTTGSSFDTEEVFDVDIGLVFTEGHLASKAAQLIKDHYEYVLGKNVYRNIPVKLICDECIKKEWYQNYCKAGGRRTHEQDWFEVSSRLGFEVSPGEYRHMSFPPWMGYFETLNAIRVKVVNDPDTVEIILR